MLNENYSNLISPLRSIKGKIELLASSISSDTGDIILEGASYTSSDALKSFTITKTGEQGKFFGYGIAQKIEIKLIDKDREIDIPKEREIKAWLSADEVFHSSFPVFYTEEPKRDEKTNELTITAYDALKAASARTVAELSQFLGDSYSLREFVEACAMLLGLGAGGILLPTEAFDLRFTNENANFEGTETIREALDDIAEATQSIYYIDNGNNLIFKRLPFNEEESLIIDNSQYMELTHQPVVTLSTIINATELGDNVTISTGGEGKTQYIRDNAFWELREDVATQLEKALTAVGGAAISPFVCSWRGNYLLECGDKIKLITKNGEEFYSYYVDDVLTYDGGLSSKTQWQNTDNESETFSNPINLGDAIRQTYARVDKVKKEISLVASDTKAIQDTVGNVSGELTTLTQKVQTTVTPEELTIEVSRQINNGVSKVETTVGTFNDDGLTVERSGSEMKTTISDDGMKVFKDNKEVLTANNVGVNATNLHATTYLIIGNNSRIEDYGYNRSGCFWIGG